MAAFSTRPVRLWFEDEARFGLHLPRYRRLTSRGVRPKQPVYSPALNPVERLWLALRRQIDVFEAMVCSQLEALREHVAGQVRALSEAQVRSLTGYGYIVSALNLAQ